MKSCLQKQSKELFNVPEDNLSFLNEIFLMENPDFLLVYNNTFEGNILILLPTSFKSKTQLKQQKSLCKLDIYHLSEISTGSVVLPKEEYDYFFLVSTEPENLDQFILTLHLLFISMKQGKGGRLRVTDLQKRRNIHQEAILQGWCIDYQNENMILTRPIMIQNTVPLIRKKTNIKKNQYNIKFDDTIELIDEDSLLEPSDLITPTFKANPCGPSTQKRKACKNCSCGLKFQETEITEKMNQMTIRLLDTNELKDVDFKQQNIPISSCGNCYLSDAFRCSRCPYFGMPAFKPGKNVELQLNSSE
ncbi:hypothetical protein PMAC_001111 [Pneumocystis sp. 'macacae']|nr:hypothetical protein PMAC_001111 [Pneumocystis sp. 'macacae']